MPARRPLICKRKGCDAPRDRGHIVCAACWRDIPTALRQRYAAARRLHLTRIAKQLGSDIVRLLGRKPDAATPNPYTRIAALTGDRDGSQAAG
ncbi:hypothetical protein [Sphingomonas hengshuiensis]|uniref:Uncharacterized protein n=1 Tax=Sphingomonas hengshuiensis TaxID=1609977 RepID=A0A7U4J8N4_9SPHN|nr:hypothetical protein [Sphingomonas hengshuiensis]AJP72288.1 hypothetical protein TS85_11555 [Sphingomonas hengshuiensis]